MFVYIESEILTVLNIHLLYVHNIVTWILFRTFLTLPVRGQTVFSLQIWKVGRKLGIPTNGVCI